MVSLFSPCYVKPESGPNSNGVYIARAHRTNPTVNLYYRDLVQSSDGTDRSCSIYLCTVDHRVPRLPSLEILQGLHSTYPTEGTYPGS